MLSYTDVINKIQNSSEIAEQIAGYIYGSDSINEANTNTARSLAINLIKTFQIIENDDDEDQFPYSDDVNDGDLAKDVAAALQDFFKAYKTIFGDDEISKMLDRSNENEHSELFPSGDKEFLNSNIASRYISNTRLSNALPEGMFSNRFRKQIPVGDRDGITKNAYVSVSYLEGNNKIYLPKKYFTEYDRQVLVAIDSLWETKTTKRPVLQPAVIYRVMVAGDNKMHPSASQLAPVIDSIRRMSNTDVEIDLTDEAISRGYKIAPGERYTIKGKLLSILEGNRYYAGKKTTETFTILSEPLLHQYSQITKQILSVNRDVYKIREIMEGKLTEIGINMTPERISIAGYLIREILIIQSNGTSDHRRFDTLFEKSGLLLDKKDYSTEQEYSTKLIRLIRNYRPFLVQCFEYWKNIGFINDYEFIYTGRKPNSIKIIVERKRKKTQDTSIAD